MKIVLGNESADLDSTVCAIVMAKNLGYVAVMNTTKAKLNLRAEVLLFLADFNMDINQLTFIDDIDCQQVESVVLVDHYENPRFSFPDLVIDHRPAEMIQAKRVVHSIHAGSCASLVAQYILEEGEIDADCATMLLYPIVKDTFNFSTEARKCFEIDLRMRDELYARSEIATDKIEYCHALFMRLEETSCNEGKMSVSDILQKDYKKFGRIGMSTSTLSSECFIQKPNWLSDCKNFMSAQNIDALYVLFVFWGPHFRRQIIQIPNLGFNDAQSTALQLVPIVIDKDYGNYEQMNTALSRKALAPLFLE